ncbi:hypothetical protein ABQX22_15275 [Xanthomonas sp. WHRI 1810A]|uniref:hypothetical protein n=1 Tax=Xanthomonas sp. WHRI 1810A TaxID=3161565 RepID=UPI0032E88EA5
MGQNKAAENKEKLDEIVSTSKKASFRKRKHGMRVVDHDGDRATTSKAIKHRKPFHASRPYSKWASNGVTQWVAVTKLWARQPQ